jgi:hypothetical protein
MENVTRHRWIPVVAYYKAEARNFTPGGSWMIGWQLKMTM